MYRAPESLWRLLSSGSHLERNVISHHLKLQERLMKVLDNSRELDFKKIKIPTTLGNWLKLNYGDALRFYFNHMVRHYLQLERIKKDIE